MYFYTQELAVCWYSSPRFTALRTSSVYLHHHRHGTLGCEHQRKQEENVHCQAVLGNTIHLSNVSKHPVTGIEASIAYVELHVLNVVTFKTLNVGSLRLWRSTSDARRKSPRRGSETWISKEDTGCVSDPIPMPQSLMCSKLTFEEFHRNDVYKCLRRPYNAGPVEISSWLYGLYQPGCEREDQGGPSLEMSGMRRRHGVGARILCGLFTYLISQNLPPSHSGLKR